ncbi:hypothetical protein PBI_SCTP2_467 [Salicola phage SCTP-2]|nr:hypothetical protein PBI_SCTP2_467 [Salicola phage SCTP-2]
MTVKTNGDVDIIDRIIIKYFNNYHILSENNRKEAVYNFNKSVREKIDTETFNKMFSRYCSNHIEAMRSLSDFNKTQQKRYFQNLLSYKGIGENQLWMEAFDQTNHNLLNLKTFYDLVVENYNTEQQDFLKFTGYTLNDEFYLNLGYFKGMAIIDHDVVNISCYMRDEYINSIISNSLMRELDKIPFFNAQTKLDKRKDINRRLNTVRKENSIDHFKDTDAECSIIYKYNEMIVLFRNAESLKNIKVNNFLNDCKEIQVNNDIQSYIDDKINQYKMIL